jgi:Tol biopolymer transport system component
MTSVLNGKITYIFFLILSTLIVLKLINLKSCYAPVWSPDGNRIAFVCKNLYSSNRAVYVKDINNQETIRLAKKINSIDPAWSSDAQRIAFTCYKKDSKVGNICISDSKGKKIVELISDDSACCPMWSPDNKQMAFSSNRGKQRDIYLFNFRTSQVTKLIEKEGYASGCSWSSDGKKIAFNYVYEKTKYSYKSKICIIDNVNQQKMICITDENIFVGGTPIWSPENTKIVFNSGGNINIIDKNGSNFITLIKSLKDYNDDFVEYANPTWSPDGKYIVFSSYTYSSLTDKKVIFDNKIYLIKVDGSENIQYLTEGLHPVWSPDGQKIAFSDNGQIKLISLDTYKKKKPRVIYPTNWQW